jgi:Winged helix DNA-binding domain
MRALGLWDPVQPSPAAVVSHLTAMQSQEHPVARWSVAQRVAGRAVVSDVDRAFEDGEILRTHVLRPTWHYVARDDLRWLMTLSGPRVLARTARRSRDLGLDHRTLMRANDVIADAVASGSQTRKEVGDVLLRKRIAVDGQRLAYMLIHAELSSVICSGPIRGKQHTYAAFDQRVPQSPVISDDEALARLARRYFTTRGAATVKDFVWWSGLSTSDARRAIELARGDLSSEIWNGRTYWFAQMTAPRTRHQVDLVQCYDEVIISYIESRDVLQTPQVAFHVPGSIDGFAHVVLVDGRLAGHWRFVTSKDGRKVETRMSDGLDAIGRRALTSALDRQRHCYDGRD